MGEDKPIPRGHHFKAMLNDRFIKKKKEFNDEEDYLPMRKNNLDEKLVKHKCWEKIPLLPEWMILDKDTVFYTYWEIVIVSVALV